MTQASSSNKQDKKLVSPSNKQAKKQASQETSKSKVPETIPGSLDIGCATEPSTARGSVYAHNISIS